MMANRNASQRPSLRAVVPEERQRSARAGARRRLVCVCSRRRESWEPTDYDGGSFPPDDGYIASKRSFHSRTAARPAALGRGIAHDEIYGELQGTLPVPRLRKRG